MTLTQMLREALPMEAHNDLEHQTIESTLIDLKNTIKEWLRTVGLPQQMSEESTRQLLITLVDEP